MSSIEPHINPYHEDRCKKDLGGFIVTCGDGAELLEFGEEVLNQVARFVHIFIVGARSFSVGLWRDDDLFSCLFERFYDSFISIKRFIRKNGLCRDAWQKSVRTLQITGLSRRKDEVEGIAESIDNGVDFGRQPAF